MNKLGEKSLKTLEYYEILEKLAAQAASEAAKEKCRALRPLDDREQAELFAEQIRETAGFKDIFYSYIGTIIGAHTGPGLVSAYYYGNGRKRAAEAEKK